MKTSFSHFTRYFVAISVLIFLFVSNGCSPMESLRTASPVRSSHRERAGRTRQVISNGARGVPSKACPEHSRRVEEIEDPNYSVPILSWLQIGPIPEPLPVFGQVKNLDGKTFVLKDLLKFVQVDVKNWRPKQGEKLRWKPGLELQWKLVVAGPNDFICCRSSEPNTPEITYLAAYLYARRWIKAELKIDCPHLFRIYLDGKLVTSKDSSDKLKEDASGQPGKVSQEIKLETGRHLLLIKSLHDPNNRAPWNIRAALQPDKECPENALDIGTSAEHCMAIKHLLDAPTISSVSISPNGDIVAVGMRRSLPPSDDSESWLELRRVEDAQLLQTYRGGMSISGIRWAPAGRKFSYTSSTKEGRTLWVVDLDQGSATALLENIKDMGGHSWAPDGSFIIYSVTEKPEPGKTGVRLLKGMTDRQPDWRDRSFLYLVNVPDGVRRRLTAGILSTSLNGISPDGSKVLFTRYRPDYTERPYSKTEFFVLNLSTKTLDSLWTNKWSSSAQWSSDGKKLLVTGGPSTFGDIGENVPKGMIPNDYDTQAYIYDVDTRAVDPITRDFAPQINQAIWSKTEKCIYFRATDRSYRRLYRYDLDKRRFKVIDTDVEVVSRLDIAENKPIAVYTGSSATIPSRAYVMDLKKKQARLLLEPGKRDFEDVVFGKVERWTFLNKQNVEIEGRIYYPPDFDPEKKYPCIVYYYGGTSPTTRDFGGRYPKNLYAAQGCVVYVLQPSGATGFGQEFSARHVNDWGIIVADEIIYGVKRFLAAHSFVDANRVGCIGASYGGFMTMLLATRTDMFAAAVAHAGISSISSHWGEGYWGYAYCAVSAANSFPWNRKDIYVEQSPLFHADKINTPLLLLHGMKDTNVPPGESIQLYTALKLLGKEVELLQVEGQNHHILQYNKRILWMKSILSWFDRWLKGQPQWWNDMYGEK